MKRAPQKPTQKPRVPVTLVKKVEQPGDDVGQTGQCSTEQDDKVGGVNLPHLIKSIF